MGGAGPFAPPVAADAAPPRQGSRPGLAGLGAVVLRGAFTPASSRRHRGDLSLSERTGRTGSDTAASGSPRRTLRAGARGTGGPREGGRRRLASPRPLESAAEGRHVSPGLGAHGDLQARPV